MSSSRRADARPLVLSVALLLAACDRAPPPAPTVIAPRAAPTLAALGGLEYTLSAFDGARVTLNAGRYEAPTDLPDDERLVASSELHPLSGIGDMDGDGSPDAAVVLSSSGGGSGTFYELVVVLNTAHGLTALPGVTLGDRIELKRLEIVGGVVHLEFLTAGPDDPLCCPRTPAVRDLRVVEGRVVESAPPAAAL